MDAAIVSAQLAERVGRLEFSTIRRLASQDDLPEAVEGVVDLPDGTAWIVDGFVTLAGVQLRVNGRVAILGSSSETSSLTFTGIDDLPAIINDTGQICSLPIQNVSMTHAAGPLFAIDGSGAALSALDWLAFNILGTPEIGTVTTFNNIIIEASAFIASAGLTFLGTFNTIAIQTSSLVTPAGRTMLTLGEGLTVNRRFRISTSSFSVAATATGIAFDLSAFPVAESINLLQVAFTGGGTYFTGVDYTDDEIVIRDCPGIVNAAPNATVYWIDNAAPTDIVMQDVFVEAAGTKLPGNYLSKFALVENALTYSGAFDRFVRAVATGSISGSANKIIALRLAIDGVTAEASQSKVTTNAGGRVESFVSQDVLQISPGEVLSLYAANTSDTSDVTITDLNITVTALNG